MPDLVTHFASAYILKVPDRWARFRIPFYLGALLPDLLSRPWMILYPPASSLVYSLHTPFMTGIFCLIIAQFFEDNIRSRVRLNLLLGVALHYSLDIFQKYLTVGYHWLFPFSWKSFGLGLFWPEDSVRFVPLWIGLILIIEAGLWYRKRRRNKVKADLNP